MALMESHRAVLPVPEPDLTPSQMIARATALIPQLRAEQDEADERGTYSLAMHETFVPPASTASPSQRCSAATSSISARSIA